MKPDALRAELAALKAENKRLKARLETFTDIGDRIESLYLCHDCQPKLEDALNMEAKAHDGE